jgi:hypothetical protein
MKLVFAITFKLLFIFIFKIIEKKMRYWWWVCGFFIGVLIQNHLVHALKEDEPFLSEVEEKGKWE